MGLPHRSLIIRLLSGTLAFDVEPCLVDGIVVQDDAFDGDDHILGDGRADSAESDLDAGRFVGHHCQEEAIGSFGDDIVHVVQGDVQSQVVVQCGHSVFELLALRVVALDFVCGQFFGVRIVQVDALQRFIGNDADRDVGASRQLGCAGQRLGTRQPQRQLPVDQVLGEHTIQFGGDDGRAVDHFDPVIAHATVVSHDIEGHAGQDAAQRLSLEGVLLVLAPRAAQPVHGDSAPFAVGGRVNHRACGGDHRRAIGLNSQSHVRALGDLDRLVLVEGDQWRLGGNLRRILCAQQFDALDLDPGVAGPRFVPQQIDAVDP